MTESIKRSLRDSTTARWLALALISLTMFFAYFFVDVAAPLQTLLEKDYGWSPETFGMLGGSEFFLNVFALFLILSGIILDKMGIRFTLITAGLTMVIGGAIKFYAVSFIDKSAMSSLFGYDLPQTAMYAFIGFAIFGIGVEMAGITVSKTIVKWFKGKELALAMGLEMATARLGVFAVFRLSPIFAEQGGVSNSVMWGVGFLCMGFLTFLIYTFMDIKLDREIGKEENGESEEEFKISDLGKIITNPGFLAIAGLCVLFYSAIFPFQKFATDMLSSKLDIPIKEAAAMFSWFPIGALILTPIIGFFLDKKGLGATLMLYGSILLIVSHLLFALIPTEAFSTFAAISTIIILGIAFSLVPASMWPSLPKIVEDRFLGSAYGLIFWIQNIGLLAVPVLIGWSLSYSNPGVGDRITALSKITQQIDSNRTEMVKIYDTFKKDFSKYENEFKNATFSIEHKNLALANHYFNANITELNNSVENLTQKFAYAKNRTIYINDLEATTIKFEAIQKDTTLNIPALNNTIISINKIKTNIAQLKEIKEDAKYNYTLPELIFAAFGVLALLLSIILKRVDRKNGYGLDLPNKREVIEKEVVDIF